MPGQDDILRAAPSIGLAVSLGHGHLVPCFGSAAWLHAGNRLPPSFQMWRSIPGNSGTLLFPCHSLGHRSWVEQEHSLSLPSHISTVSSTSVTQIVWPQCLEVLLYILASWRRCSAGSPLTREQKGLDQLLARPTDRGSCGMQKLGVLHGAGDSHLRTNKGHGKPTCGPDWQHYPSAVNRRGILTTCSQWCWESWCQRKGQLVDIHRF